MKASNFKKTRPVTRLPQSRMGGQGLYLRSLDHLGRSSEAKDRKNRIKVKCDGRTDGRTDGQTDRRTDGRTGAFIYLPKWQIIKNNDTFLEKLFHENYPHRPPPLFLMQYFSIFEENTINYHVFSCRSVKNQYF